MMTILNPPTDHVVPF